MRSHRFLVGAICAAALLFHLAARAQDEPAPQPEPAPFTAPEEGTVAAHNRFILDEYNIDAGAGKDGDRIALGLSFGTVQGNGFWWTGGPRLAYLRWVGGRADESGLGVGGAFGFGWRPDKTVSPYAGLTLDRAFGMSTFDWQSAVSLGARVKVTQDPREFFTLTFSVFHANVSGGDGPSGDDTGIAVYYSAVLFAKHR